MTIDHIASVRPGDPDYDTARTTKYDSGTPALILQPASPQEVADSIRHAQSEGLPVAIRNGGHNALSFGTIDDGVVIDLSKLNQVEVLGMVEYASVAAQPGVPLPQSWGSTGSPSPQVTRSRSVSAV